VTHNVILAFLLGAWFVVSLIAVAVIEQQRRVIADQHAYMEMGCVGRYQGAEQ
jgi:hypothetical protein